MDANQYIEIFKALAHPIRLKIAMGLLHKDNCNVNTMVEKLEVAQPTVSQCLNILKHAGIINGYRKGNNICYKIEDEEIKKLLNSINFEGCC